MAAQLSLNPSPRIGAPAPERGPDGEPSRDDEYPWVSEAQFLRRDRAHGERPLHDTAPGLPAAVGNYLEETALREAIQAMGLGPLEARVLELRASGMAIREIATRLGVGKWRVERAVVRLRARYRAMRGGIAGWQEIYLAETRRTGKS